MQAQKNRLVRSGFHVLPQMGAGTTKTIDVRVATVTGNVRAISGALGPKSRTGSEK